MINTSSATPFDENASRNNQPIQGNIPGQPSMWLFVIGDLWIFAAYYACYIYDRGQAQELFLHSQQQLSQGVGVINTVILLTSSLFIALATQSARVGDYAASAKSVTYAGLCGIGFILLKAFEWVPKISQGTTPGTNEFFMYYYMLTGLHLCHVVLGLVILTLLWRELRYSAQPRIGFVETGATYWHMVDLLWLTILALLYLMR